MSDEPDELLRRGIALEFAQLMSIWRGRDIARWSQSPETYRVLAEKLLEQSEPLMAFDVAKEGLSIHLADVRLRQLQGLALARSGASEGANAILEQLCAEGEADEETLGMLGRTYKDLAAHAATRSEREKFLKRAAQTYARAYENTGGYWTGINAATMSLLCGETEHALALAQKIHTQGVDALSSQPGEYWVLAAIGEASLILRDWSQAGEWYDRAAQQAGRRFGDLQSTRRNAHLILQHWNQDGNWIDKYLRIPDVIVFTGHMIDRPNRATPRFPDELEPAVARAIQQRIETLRPHFGFSSAACGSDILFLEAMLDRGAEVSIVLPYNEEEFVRDSVDFVSNSNWRSRFCRVLEKSARVITASRQRLELGGVSYEFCNQLLLGLAAIRCRQLGSSLIPLAVWNEKPGDGPGGAAGVVENWRALGYKPEIINLEKISSGRARLSRGDQFEVSAERQPAGKEIAAPRKNTFSSRIVAILFADAVGFSKLSESEVPRFVEHFLGAIAALTEKFSDSIIADNTWGDGLYFVFSDVDLAGDFALQLADLVGETNWVEKGLPAELNLRIALHAGPVYEFDDPITGRRSFSGTHVSGAARIEPVTPPGQVYASEAFAALAAVRRTSDFICEYVGQTPLAKGYGIIPAYHVRSGSGACGRGSRG